MNKKVDRLLTKKELTIVVRNYNFRIYIDESIKELNNEIRLNPMLMLPKSDRDDIDSVIKIADFFNDSLFNNIVGVDSDKIKISDFRDFDKE